MAIVNQVWRCVLGAVATVDFDSVTHCAVPTWPEYAAVDQHNSNDHVQIDGCLDNMMSSNSTRSYR
jgi:hypothetical protein